MFRFLDGEFRIGVFALGWQAMRKEMVFGDEVCGI